MDKQDWGNPKRIWGLEPNYDSGRMIDIYLAIKDLPVESIVDVACGTGIILDGLWWKFQKHTMSQFDIEEYPEWQHLHVKPDKKDIEDFIKEDKSFDLVMFLNAYRNWDLEPKMKFNDWLKRNAKYFITSNLGDDGPSEKVLIIGRDAKGYELKLYEL